MTVDELRARIDAIDDIARYRTEDSAWHDVRLLTRASLTLVDQYVRDALSVQGREGSALETYLADRPDIPNRDSILFCASQDTALAVEAARRSLQAVHDAGLRFRPSETLDVRHD